MKKKLLVTAMAAMPVLGMFGGNFASAAVDSNTQGIVGNNNPVTVKVSHTSEYSVIIPKEITLDNTSGSDYASAYTVQVTGDIAGGQKVTVEPAVASFDLTQAGKNNLTANVAQADTEATGEELEQGSGSKELTGKVTANSVKAGSWSGTFNFNINLQ